MLTTAGLGNTRSSGCADVGNRVPFRLYSDGVGRWISPDPVGGSIFNPQSLNRYAYVLNNPTSFTDPLGLQGHRRGCTTFWDCVHVIFCGSLYCGYNTGSPDPFDLQLFTACNGEGCSTGLDFNGATIANGLGTQQPPTNPPFRPPANNFTLGVRAPGQTFGQCMGQNKNNYSIGGAVDLAAGTNLMSNGAVSFLAGNGATSIYSALSGSAGDAATTMASNAPAIVRTAMGTGLTYGRRTASITSLNIAGQRGLPTVLSDASAGLKSALGALGDVLNLGLSATVRTGTDIGLLGAEAIGCSTPQ